jgi:hypothetical protein
VASAALVGWAAIALAIAAFVLTIHTVASQRAQLKLHEQAWKAALERAVNSCKQVLRYIAFAAAQYDKQIHSRKTSHHEAVENIQGPIGGLTAGYGRGDIPELDDLRSDSWIKLICAYRVDPPRSIGGPWTSSVPFGTDVHRPVTSVLAEQVPNALEALRGVQTMYGHLLPGEVSSALERAIGNRFPEYLATLPGFLRTRSLMEDSRFPDVRLVGSMGAPDIGSFENWVESLIELEQTLEDP